MIRVGFVTHPGRPDASEMGKRAAEWLMSMGHEVEFSESLKRWSAQEVDLAVSLGGDGTMLRTVDMALEAGVPVLGVNLGNLGYLTEVEPEELIPALERFLAGEYRIEERLTLEVSIHRGSEPAVVARTHAFNDVVLERTGAGHTIRVAVSFAGEAFMDYAADGLVLATPTGSTAYNLSARGPIISPLLDVMVLTPVSPHMLFDRSLVLAAQEVVRMDLLEVRNAALSVDGMIETTLAPGEAIEVRGGHKRAKLVRFGSTHFHALVRKKFGLGGPQGS